MVSSNDINNLSNDMLSMVADYLPKTSRALLAVALMHNNEPSTASKAIISSVKDNAPYKSLIEDLLIGFGAWDIEAFNRQKLLEPKSCMNYKPQPRKARYYGKINTIALLGSKGLGDQISEYYNRGWEILDFIDIPKSLASKLTDDDLSAMLVCIDAKLNLKRLNLTYCVGIIGQGLEPLRGSTVLEKLDLALVRQMEMPQAFNDMQLSEEVVYDILYGILEVDGNKFQRLQVPLAWCNNGENNCLSERLTQLIDIHDLAFMNEKNLCAYFGYDNAQSLFRQLDKLHNVRNSRGDVTDWCIGHGNCKGGDFDICADCNKVMCCGCDDLDMCNNDECNIVSCSNCRDGEETETTVSWCGAEWCDSRCGDCRFRECCNGTIDCEYCKAKVLDRLITENNSKQTEIEQLQRELDQLRVV